MLEGLDNIKDSPKSTATEMALIATNEYKIPQRSNLRERLKANSSEFMLVLVMTIIGISFWITVICAFVETPLFWCYWIVNQYTTEPIITICVLGSVTIEMIGIYWYNTLKFHRRVRMLGYSSISDFDIRCNDFDYLVIYEEFKDTLFERNSKGSSSCSIMSGYKTWQNY